MSGAPLMEQWELSARESCRDAIAGYTHAGDRFLMDRYVGVFTADGVLEIRGQEPLVGREAIFDYFTMRPLAEKVASAPTIMRHNVTNVLFEELSPERIQVASYFTVFSDIGLDHMGRYRDTMVPEADAWRIAHRFVSTDWHSPQSLFT